MFSYPITVLRWLATCVGVLQAGGNGIVLTLVIVGVIWFVLKLKPQRYVDHAKYWALKQPASFHSWVPFMSSGQPQYCSYCKELIAGFWIFGTDGWSCSICRRSSHVSCLPACDKLSCKGTGSATQDINSHQLVQGNLPNDAVCNLCGVVCYSLFGLHGMRCLWCLRCYHDTCAELLSARDECDCGEFAKMMISLPLGKALMQEKCGDVPEFSSSVASSRFSIGGIFPKKRNKIVHAESVKLSLSSEITNCLGSLQPLLVFVNGKSGGQAGNGLIREFFMHFNPLQVIDINVSGGPSAGLEFFRPVALAGRLRILACGGDGTAGWIIQTIRKLYEDRPIRIPVAILPLGTGNDLSRVLGWGDSFKGDLKSHLKRLLFAKEKALDLWELEVTTTTSPDPLYKTTFSNYLDFGAPARVGGKFHKLRDTHPELFQSRLGNKFLYGEIGMKDLVTAKSLGLSAVKIVCDDKEVIFPEDVSIEGLIVMNIPSFAGGVDMWQNDRICQSDKSCLWHQQDMNDGILEVSAIRSLLHLGQIQVGLASTIRICQGRRIEFHIPVNVPCEIDGEPTNLPPCTVKISHQGESWVLSPRPDHDTMIRISQALDAAFSGRRLSVAERNSIETELSRALRN